MIWRFALSAPVFSLSSFCRCAGGIAGTAGVASVFSSSLVLDKFGLVNLPVELRRLRWLSLRLGTFPRVGALRSLSARGGSLLLLSGCRLREAAIVGSCTCFVFSDLRPKGQMAISSSDLFSNSSPPLRRLLRRQHTRADSLKDSSRF